MKVSAIKTVKVVLGQQLFPLLDSGLPQIRERQIVVITSKVVSICEGRIIKEDPKSDKKALVRNEADYYIENTAMGDIGFYLTINDDILIANSGIDESNGNGNYILWPKNPMKSAEAIWRYLKGKFGLSEIGVIITDSRIIPMRWGTLGFGLSWCGFNPLNNYIGTPDIFGRKLRVTNAAILDGLAASAVLVMGEGNEQTPLAVIDDVPFVTFRDKPPTDQEITEFHITRSQDIYAPLIDSPRWKKGKQP